MSEINVKDLVAYVKGIKSFSKLSSMANSMQPNLKAAARNKCSSFDKTSVAKVLLSSEFHNEPFSGGMLADFFDNIERATSNMEGSVKRTVEDSEKFKNDFEDLLTRTASSLDTTLYTGHTKSIIKEYMKNFQVVSDILLGKDDNYLELDSGALSRHNDELQRSYSTMVSYLGVLQSMQLDGSRKLNQYEQNVFAVISSNASKELNSLKELRQTFEDNLDATKDFKEVADHNAKNISNLYDSKVQAIQDTLAHLQRGRFFAAASSAKNIGSSMSKANDHNKAVSMFSKAISSFLGPWASFLPVLEVAVKVLSALKGALFGFNDDVAEFNKALIGYHGAISQGITLIPDPDVSSISKMFNKYNDLMSSYGVDSATFLSREEILTLTSSFEKYGKDLASVAGSKELLKEHMHAILKMHSATGLSLEESSDYVAKWNHVMGLDLKEIGVITSEIARVSKLTGFSSRHLLESLNNVNADYGLTTVSLMTVLKAQELALTKGRMTQKTNSEAMNELIARLKSMSEGDFAKMMHPLESNGRLRQIIVDEIMLFEEAKKSVTSEQQKMQLDRKIYLLRQSLSQDSYWQRSALRREASIETLIRMYSESMQAHMGKEFKESLEKGVMTYGMEQTFKALLSFSGSPSDLEKLKEASYIAINSSEQFSKNAALKNIQESLSDQNKRRTEEEDIIKATMQAQKTVAEMRTVFFQKWLTKIVTAADLILSHLRGWWFNKLLGGSNTTAGDTDIKVGDTNALIAKLATATGDERKKILDEIDAKLADISSSGGDIKSLFQNAISMGLPDDLKSIFDKHSSGSGGGAGGVAIDIGSVKYDEKRGAELWEKGQQGAAMARRQSGQTSGWCMAGVQYTFSLFKDTTLQPYGSAYMAADALAKHSRFSEVTVKDSNTIINAPRGSIVVYGPNPGAGTRGGYKHGHIAIMDGTGWEISDHKERSSGTHYAKGWRRLFVPSLSGSGSGSEQTATPAPAPAPAPPTRPRGESPAPPRPPKRQPPRRKTRREVSIHARVPGGGKHLKTKVEKAAKRKGPN